MSAAAALAAARSGGRARVAAPPHGAPPASGRTPRNRRTPAAIAGDPPEAAVKEGGQGEGRTLLRVQPDSNSDTSSASQSPRSDTESCTHQEDAKDSAAEGSIAVDCATSPAEVIVQGKNVKKIRVKFPPHPPAQPDPAKARPQRLTHAETSMEFHQIHPKCEDGIPLSQEESSSPSDSSTWSVPPLPRDSGVHSRLSRDYSMPCLTSLNRGLDMDGKFKQDILHGLEYFEQRNDELKKVNKQILRDLERMTETNNHLEDHIEQLNKRFSLLADENDELKIKMDQLDKENSRLQEQAVSEWSSRIKVEEMYMEAQREAEQQMKTLKDKVDEQNRELQNLRKGSNKEASLQHQKKERDLRLADQTLELTHKISQLEAQVQQLNADKEGGQESQQRLRGELTDLRDLHKQKVAELEAQYKRFLSLKKSFNDLTEEHDNLRKQVRGRREAVGNSTWPSNKAHNTETVHLIDLPAAQVKATAGVPYKSSSFQKGTPLLKPPTPGTGVRGKVPGHTRGRSEGLFMPDNLPPVSSPAK